MRAIVQEYQENPSEKLKAQLTTMELKFLARSTGKKSKKSKGQAKEEKQKPVEEEKQKD